ncbi:MAG TPA: lytic murein transglycosylase [Jatrophihabitans sp.]|nr:lytic murein transglycosylase [Jatrophihabitans sp.]
MIVITMAVLLVLPAVRSGGSRVAAATVAAPPVAATGAASSSAAPARPADPAWVLAAGDIRPSRIGSALPIEPVADVVYGPAGPIGALGIPVMVLRAYHLAADRLALDQPACKLPWWLLAGIGHTESGHAESGRLLPNGTTRGRILGPVLNGGIAGDAVITDTDHGFYDGDTRYDRAVGPMQFIPSTWVIWGADGNGDGKRDPNNIYDSTLAAARYLCADGRNLSTAAGIDAAVLSYNHSLPYLETVLAWGTAYRDGASSVQDSPLPVVVDVTKVRPPVSSRPPTHKINISTPANVASASGSPSASGSGPLTSSDTAQPSCTESSSTSASTSGHSSTAGKPSAVSSSGSASVAASTSRPSGSSSTSGSSSASASGSSSASAAAASAGTATADGSLSPVDKSSSPVDKSASSAATSSTSSSTSSPQPTSCASK